MKFNIKALMLSAFFVSSFLCSVSLATVSFNEITFLDSPDTLKVKLHFHIVRDLELTKNGTTMTGYIRKGVVKGRLLRNINKTWAPADIVFEAASVQYRESQDYNGREEDIEKILTITGSDNFPNGTLKNLIDTSKDQDDGINIWIFPYLGETNQGFNYDGAFRTIAGRYSDKMNGGEQPQKAKVVEGEPMDIGSLARTIAHEIGHVLNLEHNQSPLDGSGHLMGGQAVQGYNLTDDQIETARNTILDFARL